MKYGESLFDIAYLVIAIGTGIYLLANANERLKKLILFTFLKKKKDA